MSEKELVLIEGCPAEVLSRSGGNVLVRFPEGETQRFSERDIDEIDPSEMDALGNNLHSFLISSPIRRKYARDNTDNSHSGACCNIFYKLLFFCSSLAQAR